MVLQTSIMKLEYYVQWEIITYFQLIFFAVLLLATVILILSRRKLLYRHNVFWKSQFLVLFEIFQVTGAILGLVFMHSQNGSLGVYISAYSFDSIGIAFLIRNTTTIAELCAAKTNFKGRFIPHKLFILALILGGIGCLIAGSNTMAKTDSNENKISLQLMKAGNYLFLGAVLSIMANLPRIHTPEISKSILILFITMLFVIVRIAYGLFIAFRNTNISSSSSEFLLFYGHYKYYASMALAMSIAACFGFVINLFVLSSDEHEPEDVEFKQETNAVNF